MRGAGRRAYSHVLIKCDPLPNVDEGEGRSFAPLRINSGSLLIILYPKRIAFSPSPEDISADRVEPVEVVCAFDYELNIGWNRMSAGATVPRRARSGGVIWEPVER